MRHLAGRRYSRRRCRHRQSRRCHCRHCRRYSRHCRRRFSRDQPRREQQIEIFRNLHFLKDAANVFFCRIALSHLARSIFCEADP